MASSAGALEQIQQQVGANLEHARAAVRRLRFMERACIWGSIGLNLLVFLSGGTASLGKQKLMAEVPWTVLCGSLAVCSGLAAALVALRDAFHIGDKLRSALDCAARLKVIELQFLRPEPDLNGILQQYEGLRRDHEQFLV